MGDRSSSDRRSHVRGPHGSALLSAEQIAVLSAVHRRFARFASESLSTLVRTPCRVRLAAADRPSCSELRARWAPPAALASVVLDPLPGALLAVDRVLAFLLIDRLLGGRGAPAVPERGLSEIEGMVLQRGITALLPDLQRAWAPVCAVVPRLEYLEREADTTELPAAGTRLVCATYAAAAGGEEGRLHLAMAEASLAAVGHRLLAREVPPPQSPRAAGAGAMVTVELGADGLRGGGAPALDEGMVIGMSRFAGEAVAIEMNREQVARGRVVAWQDSYGIRVTEILDSGGETDSAGGRRVPRRR
ncbi:MAG: FliM/FliN family flagellar motor switch protein [Spirochaetaceae bacterium]|nr:FliM/FliN family flagellar motor switch protein [Spirochaetaceae bacterium]